MRITFVFYRSGGGYNINIIIRVVGVNKISFTYNVSGGNLWLLFSSLFLSCLLALQFSSVKSTKVCVGVSLLERKITII